MNSIALPPDLYQLLLLYAKDNGTSIDQAATEMIAFFLKPVKDKLK